MEELLDARIDVWTALNIQHLESLADVVARIAGVSVRETVPDIVLRDADDIVLVDITSEDLIQRLKDGKVYLPETAQLAQQKFFTLRNLTALREIALRRTAARVDDQMVEQLRQGAIGGPWETSERLLVCVGPDALSMDVVRAASRLATGLNATWVAATVDRPGGDAAGGGAADAALQLAQSLGAETTRLVGHDLPAEILGYAERENITQIVVGRSKAGLLGRLAGRSLSDALAHRASLVGVHVVTGDKPREAPRGRSPAAVFDRALPIGALAAAGSVAVAVGVGEALDRWLRLPNLSMIFLIAVLLSAARFGVRAAIVAAVLSFLAYDFFFVPPYYQFTIAQPAEFFALVIFLAVASLVGWLAGRARDQERLARASAQRRARCSSSAQAVRRLGAETSRPNDRLRPRRSGGQRRHCCRRTTSAVDHRRADHRPLDAGDNAAARWDFERASRRAGTGTLPKSATVPAARDLARRVGAAASSRPTATRRSPTSSTRSTSCSNRRRSPSTARCWSRPVRTVALEENEKLRGTLLASLSHDLRTPLATITGAVTTLRKFGDGMTPEQRADLLASIEEESERLTRFIANLLDMSRIEAGALKPKQDLVDVVEVVRAAIERAGKAFAGQPIMTSLARDLPYVRGDANLLEQVLFNLLDNAQKYGGDGRVIVHARPDGANVVVSVTDEGPGIKPADLERVFEKFYRGGSADGRRAGTGLGLSISRGLVEAMGGKIWAESPAVRRRGARIVISMPAVEARQVAKAAS